MKCLFMQSSRLWERESRCFCWRWLIFWPGDWSPRGGVAYDCPGCREEGEVTNGKMGSTALQCMACTSARSCFQIRFDLNLSLGRLFGISLRWSSRESGASHLSPACETWDRSDHHVLINWKTSQPHFTLSNIPASENPPLLAFSCKPSSVEFASLPPSRNKPKQSSWLGSSGESLSETHQETHLQPNPPLPHLP